MRLEKLFPIGFILVLIGFFIVFLASVPLEGGGIVIFPFFIFASGDGLIPAILIITIIFFVVISVLFWFHFPKRAFEVGDIDSLEHEGDLAEAKYCIACGTTLPKKAKYCWRCRAIQPDYLAKENGEK
ncbi:MAG: hypothetical protein ACFE7E_07175 [Candidatus Hodarchaeota archaeon]